MMHESWGLECWTWPWPLSGYRWVRPNGGPHEAAGQKYTASTYLAARGTRRPVAGGLRAYTQVTVVVTCGGWPGDLQRQRDKGLDEESEGPELLGVQRIGAHLQTASRQAGESWPWMADGANQDT